MTRKLSTLFALCFAVSYLATSQVNAPAPSPPAKIEQKVGVTDVTIEYSRPGVKGRKVFGDMLPYGEFWRTGANTANKFTFSDDVTVAGNNLAAGSYTLLTKPGETTWELFFYPYESGNSGSYQEKEPAAKFSVEAAKMEMSVESMTFDVGRLTNDGAAISLLWENTWISFPLGVSTKEKVMAQIDSFEKNPQNNLANTYNTAASYLFAEKELDRALKMITKAVEIRPEAFWMMYTKSQIEAELGQKDAAIKSAEMSLAAAEKANNAFYINQNKKSLESWK